MDNKKWKLVSADRNNESSHLFNISSTTTAEKVISIDVIRWKLFQDVLSAVDLLECRLVCKKWTREATAALLLPKFERFLCVTFKYTTNGPNPHKYVHEPTGRSLKEWLEDRHEAKFSPLSRHFPCTSFKFESGPLGENEDSCRFFMDAGAESGSKSHVIRSLSLSLWQKSFGLEVAPFLQLIHPWVSNLKYLRLQSAPNYYDTDAPIYCPPVSPPHGRMYYRPPSAYDEPDGDEWAVAQLEERFGRVQLLALETLEMGDMGTFYIELCPRARRYAHKIVLAVLNRAPNLKRTIDPESWNLKAIWLEKKVQTVGSWFFVPKCVEITYPNWTDKRETEILLEESPKELREFGIDLAGMRRPLSSQELQCVSSVLKNSQRSLEHIWDVLELLQCSKYGLEIPQLPNVTVVTQGTPYKPNPNRIEIENPGNANEVKSESEDDKFEMEPDLLSRICPNARHLIINGPRPWNFIRLQEFFHLNRFDQFDPLTSVSKVTVHFDNDSLLSSFASPEIGSVLKLCPNLRVLQLVCLGSRPLTFPQLFGQILVNFKSIQIIAFQFHSEFPSKVTENIENLEEWVSRMDAVVTGFSPEKCRQLALQLELQQHKLEHKETPVAPVDGLPAVKNLEGERASSSILDLKDLMCLRFEFRPRLGRKQTPFFSMISFLNGFHVLTHRQNFYLDCPKYLFHHFSA